MGWRYLGFTVVRLQPGERRTLATAGQETAVVTIAGAGTADADGVSFELSRRGVFEETASLLYVPPDASASLVARTEWLVAFGQAPATGRYPVHLVTPDEVQVELRGGGPARRQVNHLLAAPLPAERLIVYEVFVPGGAWAGWPPHCHDGSHGSPYLEETYFFRFDRPDGFGFHRNYVPGDSFDEVLTATDLACVSVPRGFHVTAAAPGHNMWILNFLAGEPTSDERANPPYFDPATTWITKDWEAGQMPLPTNGAPAGNEADER